MSLRTHFYFFNKKNPFDLYGGVVIQVVGVYPPGDRKVCSVDGDSGKSLRVRCVAQFAVVDICSGVLRFGTVWA